LAGNTIFRRWDTRLLAIKHTNGHQMTAHGYEGREAGLSDEALENQPGLQADAELGGVDQATPQLLIDIAIPTPHSAREPLRWRKLRRGLAPVRGSVRGAAKRPATPDNFMVMRLTSSPPFARGR